MMNLAEALDQNLDKVLASAKNGDWAVAFIYIEAVMTNYRIGGFATDAQRELAHRCITDAIFQLKHLLGDYATNWQEGEDEG